jgi:hypothetical protein
MRRNYDVNKRGFALMNESVRRGSANCLKHPIRPARLDRRKETKMRGFSKGMSAVALAVTAASSVSVPADARVRHHRHHYYYGRTAYAYRYCRYSPGATGLIAGGVGGALAGPGLIGHGLLGTALGAVGGAFAGRAIDRTITAPRRCYYR